MWCLESRVHRLNQFPSNQVQCFIKRDDELGCGISGSKLRKYSSLIPFLHAEKITHLIIVAGPQSNNLLSLLQLARELNLKVTAMLIKPWSMKIQGNFKLSKLFLPEQDIIWIERHDWHQILIIAQHYARTLNEKSFVLSEGASVLEAMPGSMSLADDIVRNERVLQRHFQHIFIDAGSGFSAAALIKRLQQVQHNACIHVLLLADTKTVFLSKLLEWTGISYFNGTLMYPSTAKAFGSVNQSIKNEIKRIALEEGILADPIYAAKLLYESRQYIVLNELQGNVLIIHSGGTLTMAGFDY